MLKDGQIPSAAERYIKSLTHIQKMFDLNPEQTKVPRHPPPHRSFPFPATLLCHYSRYCVVFYMLLKASKELALSCHLNLAISFIKLEAWTRVIDNCEKALLIDLSNSKALFRRATALYMKKEYKLALSDLRRANQEDGVVRRQCSRAGFFFTILFGRFRTS